MREGGIPYRTKFASPVNKYSKYTVSDNPYLLHTRIVRLQCTPPVVPLRGGADNISERSAHVPWRAKTIYKSIGAFGYLQWGGRGWRREKKRGYQRLFQQYLKIEMSQATDVPTETTRRPQQQQQKKSLRRGKRVETVETHI